LLRAIGTLVLAALLCAATAEIASAQLKAEGTELVLTTSDGRVLRSRNLVGATLMMNDGGEEIAVTIESVEEDADAVGGRVFLHRFRVKDESGAESDYCQPDAEGKNLGFPVPNDSGGFELTCTSGALGKCIRWGYRPWEETPGGPALRSLHQACIFMVRADYGGDGNTHTRDGTLIAYCDRFAINRCEGEEAAMPFEAAWGESGAACVARTRIPAIVSLEELATRYPQLRGRLGPDACSEARAMRMREVLLFNRSEEGTE
jgi:hypothetical protein